MKKHNFYLLIFTVFTGTLFAQEPSEKIKLLTGQPWELNKMISGGEENKTKQVYTFMIDNTLIIYKGDQTIKGKWKFDASESLLIIDGGVWDILTLNSEVLRTIQMTGGVKTERWFKAKKEQ